MNNHWQFSIPGQTKPHAVQLPHTMVELPLNHVDEASFQVVGRYERIISWEERFLGNRVFLKFYGAAHVATVTLNQVELLTHYGGYTSFEVELTENLIVGDNHLQVDVSALESENLPPFGHVVDYLAPGGLYREVELIVRPQTFLEETFLEPVDVLSEPKLRLTARLIDPMGKHHLVLERKVHRTYVSVLDRLIYSDVCEVIAVSDAPLWSPEEPHLVEFRVSLDGHSEVFRVGFREAKFLPDGFYLNGKKRSLIGLNRHQSYPYVGYAMPQSMQRYDAKILKDELCLDVVRTSHYPQSQHFFDACDELGLFVITETPGWQHLGDDEWQERSLQMTKEMVLQYRHHPSIILWGTRINESIDHESFYSKSNAIAKTLDPSRQTTGVRAHRQSQLLEDVYGYNDFSHNGQTPGLLPKSLVCDEVAYFVAEHNGHMYPTKSFDHESLRLNQLKRHARVLDSYYQAPSIGAVIGWCLSDYYTHSDFGSGDSICYHGVMDAFRNPKPAALVYAVNTKKPFLKLASNLSIGEYPAILMKEIVVITNQAVVRVKKNGHIISTLSREWSQFPGLPNPPLILDDLVGNQLEPLGFQGEAALLVKNAMNQVIEQGLLEEELQAKVEPILKSRGFSVDDLGRFYTRFVGNWGEKAAEYEFEAGDLSIKASARKQPKLEYIVSHYELIEAESYDVAAVRIQASDESGTRLPYLQEALALKVSGSIELIGPSVISLIGGASGFYVKSKSLGLGKVVIKSARFGAKELNFNVRTGSQSEVAFNHEPADWDN